MKKITVTLIVEVDTNKSIEDVKAGIKKGIYRGLDSAPHNIAPPSNVNVIFTEDTPDKEPSDKEVDDEIKEWILQILSEYPYKEEVIDIYQDAVKWINSRPSTPDITGVILLNQIKTHLKECLERGIAIIGNAEYQKGYRASISDLIKYFEIRYGEHIYTPDIMGLVTDEEINSYMLDNSAYPSYHAGFEDGAKWAINRIAEKIGGKSE